MLKQTHVLIQLYRNTRLSVYPASPPLCIMVQSNPNLFTCFHLLLFQSSINHSAFLTLSLAVFGNIITAKICHHKCNKSARVCARMCVCAHVCFAGVDWFLSVSFCEGHCCSALSPCTHHEKGKCVNVPCVFVCVSVLTGGS